MTTSSLQDAIDLIPMFNHLDFLEDLIRASGYEAAAAHLFSYPMRGEPVMLGRDPISGYLSDAAPPEVEVEVRRDELLIRLFSSAEARKPFHTCRFDLDDFPGVSGFVYCVEDLRFLELSPPHPRLWVNTAT